MDILELQWDLGGWAQLPLNQLSLLCYKVYAYLIQQTP